MGLIVGMLSRLFLKMIFVSMMLLPGDAIAASESILTMLPDSARWALEVRELETGEVVISQGSSGREGLVPASLSKLWISGAAFASEEFPVGETLLLASGAETVPQVESIYLKGRGNALLITAELQQTVATLAKNGLQKVKGDIVADASFFDSADWIRVRKGSAYAPPAALGLDLHTIQLRVQPKEQGQPPQVLIDPPNAAVRLALAARTVTGGIQTLQIAQLDDLSYKLSGNLPDTAGVLTKRFALADPALYAAGVLMTLLKDAGISVAGDVRKGRTPQAVRLLATLKAPASDELLRDMNHHSLNVVADNLLLSLGAQRFGPPGTRRKGVGVVNDLFARLDLPLAEVRVVDGSGLSEQNRSTANFMTRYLVEVAKENWFERFKKALPRPGAAGIASHSPFITEHFWIKTGRLENVYSLAGYGSNEAGKKLVFCFIANDPGIGVLPNMDEVGTELLKIIATVPI